MMERSEWIEALSSVLEEFCSEEFQKRVWLRGDGPEVSSFVEAYCRFFDDLDANRLIDVEWRQLGLTKFQKDKLESFRDILAEFGQGVPDLPRPEEVLEHPNWPNVRKAARNALTGLRLQALR